MEVWVAGLYHGVQVVDGDDTSTRSFSSRGSAVDFAVNCHGRGGPWLVSGLTASYAKGFRAFTGRYP